MAGKFGSRYFVVDDLLLEDELESTNHEWLESMDTSLITKACTRESEELILITKNLILGRPVAKR